MTHYRLYGLEMSPYSVKVRSVLRYKQLPHEWIVRSMDKMPTFQKYARLPLVPLVVDENEQAQQDSTPIIESLEAAHPVPSLLSGDLTMDFLSALLEEFADEWLNKPMFHFRWHHATDADSAAARIAAEMAPPGTTPDMVQSMAAGLKTRMVPRLSFVGSSDQTAALIEHSFYTFSTLLETHLAARPFLFGGRPLLADFGIYGQYKELLSDPTPQAWLHANCPQLCAYIATMESPQDKGDCETLTTLEKTLLPLLQYVSDWFVPWTQANAAALQHGQTEFTVELNGESFTQAPQKYHARSWDSLLQKYAALQPAPALLDTLLQKAGLLMAFKA